MTEAALKDRAMEMLRARFPSGFFWRQGATSFGRSGVSDILGVVDGYAVALEAKQPGRYEHPSVGLSKAQIAFAKKYRDAGGIFIAFDNVERLYSDLWTDLKRIRG